MILFSELAEQAAWKFAESPKTPEIAVVGDSIIDLHQLCSCDRIAQEVPVPVWKTSETFVMAGGAAAVAGFANDLDCRVALVSAAGNGKDSVEVMNSLSASGVCCDSVVNLGEWTPATKTRIWVESSGSILQLSARLDSGSSQFPNLFQPATCGPDGFGEAVIVADYGKGFVIPSLLRIPEGVRTFVDPAPGLRGDLRAIYAGRTDWLILNETEFEGLEFGDSGPGNLIRKRDRAGVVVLTDDGGSFSLPGIVNRPRYVSGAGDMFIAAFAAATCSGLTPEESAAVGHLAAALLIRELPFDRRKIDRELIYEFACELPESVSE